MFKDIIHALHTAILEISFETWVGYVKSGVKTRETDLTKSDFGSKKDGLLYFILECVTFKRFGCILRCYYSTFYAAAILGCTLNVFFKLRLLVFMNRLLLKMTIMKEKTNTSHCRHSVFWSFFNHAECQCCHFHTNYEFMWVFYSFLCINIDKCAIVNTYNISRHFRKTSSKLCARFA